jgi:hypothetical protein
MKPNVLYSVVVAVLCCCTDLLVPRSSSALALSRLTSVAPRLPGNGDSGFGRRAGGATGTAHHCRGHPAEEGAHGRADENVARVVDAGVHAGKCHDRRCATQRKLERRQQVSDGNGERGGGRGVTGRNDVDEGMVTHRCCGTPSPFRSGRWRSPIIFMGWFTTGTLLLQPRAL